MNFSKLRISLLMLFSGLLLVAGCDTGDSNTDDSQRVAIKMRVASSQTVSQPAKAQNSAVDEITEIKLLVEELELESAIDNDSLDFEVEDIAVNLPLDGSAFELTSAMIPEGLYNEFEMEVDYPDEDVTITNPDFEDGNKRFSVVIKGIQNGEAFTYGSQREFELEFEFAPALEISETSSTVAIAIFIDPSGWFVDPETGEPLNPNNPDHREQIDENIEQSFDAEREDEDEDEDDDD